jgi:hypothetical protein
MSDKRVLPPTLPCGRERESKKGKTMAVAIHSYSYRRIIFYRMRLTIY